MKKALIMSLMALAISTVFVFAAMAQQKPAQTPTTPAQEPKLDKFSGTIQDVDMTKKDLIVQRKNEKKDFSIDDHTKIMEGKKELTFSDLKKGLWASVEYKSE